MYEYMRFVGRIKLVELSVVGSLLSGCGIDVPMVMLRLGVLVAAAWQPEDAQTSRTLAFSCHFDEFTQRVSKSNSAPATTARSRLNEVLRATTNAEYECGMLRMQLELAPGWRWRLAITGLKAANHGKHC